MWPNTYQKPVVVTFVDLWLLAAINLKLHLLCLFLLDICVSSFRLKARAILRGLMSISAALFIALIFPNSASAQSPGCSKIDSAFGSGYTAQGYTELYLNDLSLKAGDVISYAVTSTGSTNANRNLGGGFAIYGEMDNIVYLEEYATAGNELNLNADFVVPVDADDYVVYVWGTDFNPATVVQATVKCAADGPAIPSIAGLSPSAGNTAGGSSVVLTGTNLTGATAVTFGGAAATSYSVDSDTQITAATPAHAAGPVDVAVTTPVSVRSDCPAA